jgi:MORN repeat
MKREIWWVFTFPLRIKVVAPEKPSEHPNIRRIRHGIGVQLFGTTEENVMCKYEGHWKLDKKHGLGICTYPDKSVYNGNMVEDVRIGYGKYTWPNGDVYDGNWKEEKMEGGGKFYHHSVWSTNFLTLG